MGLTRCYKTEVFFYIYKIKWQEVKWSDPYCSLLWVRHHEQELKAAVLTLQYRAIRSLRHSTTRRGGQGEDDGDALPQGIYEFSSPLTFSHTGDIHAQNCKHSLQSGMRKCSGFGTSPLNPLNPLPGVLLLNPVGGFAPQPRHLSANNFWICPWQHALWHVIIFCTSSSAIAERPRCRVRHSFRQKWKTGTGRQYFADIFNHIDVIGQQSYRIRWTNAK